VNAGPAAIAGQGPWRTVFDNVINLGAGREWHSNAFQLQQGNILSIDADSPDTRFFAGLFSQANYDAARRRSRGMFPFRLGTDQVAFHRAYNVQLTTNYRIVVRVSLFQPGGNIRLQVRVA
jgi:hypothetical protein